jgi:capping protein (actin filament) muscle Z-line, beta
MGCANSQILARTQTEQSLTLQSTSMIAHLENMGKMVEDMEGKLRNTLQEVYFGRTRDIVNDLRSVVPLDEVKEQNATQAKLVSNLQNQ